MTERDCRPPSRSGSKTDGPLVPRLGASQRGQPPALSDRARDGGITPVVAAVLLLGICLVLVAMVALVAHTFGQDPPPAFLSLDARGCTTTGQWTVARFDVISATRGLDPTTLRWADGTTGKANTDDTAPLVLVTPGATLTAGDRAYLYTQPGRADDISCDTANQLIVTQPSANRILTTPRFSISNPVRVLALSVDDCSTTSTQTAATLIITRAPPGWSKNDLRVDDVQTGASTEATGNARLQVAGASAPVIQTNDVLELTTKHNQAEQLSCTDMLHIVDSIDGTTLRDVTLTP